MQTRSQLIDLTVTEVLETTRRAVDRMRISALQQSLIQGGFQRSDFWEGYLKALNDLKEIIRDV